MKAVTYVGPHDGVDVEREGAFLATVMRGESHEFADGIADSLLAQGSDNWKLTAAPSKEGK
jgi:hypothetical protein